MMRSPVILGVISSLRPRRSGMRLGGHGVTASSGQEGWERVCSTPRKTFDFTRETVKRSDRETVSFVVGVREKTRDHRTRHHVFYRLQSANGVDVRLLVLLPTCRDVTSRAPFTIDDLETRWRFCCLRRNRKHTRVANRQPCRQQSSADQVRGARRRVPSFSQASSAHARHVARRHSRLAPLYSDSRPRISSSTTTLVEPLCLSATGVALLVSYA